MFYYKDYVKVTHGFYKGQSGVVVGHLPTLREYEINPGKKEPNIFVDEECLTKAEPPEIESVKGY